MFEVTAICKTTTCAFLDKESIFISSAIDTQCGACGQMMDVSTKEVTNGSAEETV